jgi:hypothetical protein
MTTNSTIGFIQIEILNKNSFVVKKISNGIEKMFQIEADFVVSKNFEDLKTIDTSFCTFLLKEIQHTYQSLISHSDSFNFETSFLDTNLKKKYLCHLTLSPQDENNKQLFDITLINVSIQSKNIFLLEEVLQRTSTVVGEDFFDSISLLFHDFFGVTAAYVGFFIQNNTKNYLHSFAKNGVLSKGITLELHGSTCDLVLRKGEVTIESDIDSHVPNPPNPLSFKREAFLGQPITNQFGQIIGLIGVQHESMIQDVPLMRSIMRILAPRTFSEYSRLHAQKSLIDKNLYYQFIIENIASNIISTNAQGIIQNVTNSVYNLIGYSSSELLGTFVGATFNQGKDSTTQKLFFSIISSNFDSPIVAKVSTNNYELKQLTFETKKFQIETGEVQYVFILKENTTQEHLIPENQKIECYQREAKILELRNVLLDLQQSQTKDSQSNLDLCLRTVSSVLQVEYTGYWSLVEDRLECNRYYELEKSEFNSEIQGLILPYSEYKEYIDYFTSLTEPSFVYDVFSNTYTSVFNDYFIKFDIHYMMEVPMWVNGSLTGMFCLEGKSKDRRFEEYEISFISAVSVIISQNIAQLLNSKFEQDLLTIQSQLHSVYHKTSLPLVIIDIESFTIMDVNSSWLQTFGVNNYESNENSLLQIGFFEQCNPELLSQLRQFFSENIEVKNIPFTWQSNDNKQYYFRLSTTHFEVNNTTFAVLIFHDVTDIISINLPLEATNNSKNFKNGIIESETSESEPISLRAFAEELLKEFNLEAETKSLSLSIFVDENLPEYIRVQKAKLKELISNVVRNSIQNTEIGFVSLSFVLQSVTDESINLIIEIKDSGVGMSEQKVNNIFESFNTSNANHNQPINSGLMMVKNILSTFNGSITVESTIGLGTTVTLELPIIPIHLNNLIETNNEDSTVINTKIHTEDLLFLVMKHPQMKSDNYEMVLNDNGASIYSTTTLEETLQACEFVHFNCMILFIETPKIEDIPLLSLIQLQPLNSNTPIIIITSTTNEHNSSLQTIAVETLHFSSQLDSFVETLEILFPSNTVVQGEII